MDKDNKERIHYIRKSSNSVMPTDDEEKDLFNLANRVPFDDRINHEAEISDLNITLLFRTGILSIIRLHNIG